MSNELLMNFDTAVPQKLFRGAVPANGTDPAFRAAGNVYNINSQTTAAPQVPAGVQAGDLLLLVFQVTSTTITNLTAPAGWATLVPMTQGSARGGTVAVFYKTATASDASSAPSISWTTSANGVAYVMAYSGWDIADGAAALLSAVAGSSTSASTDTPTTPSGSVPGGKYIQFTHYSTATTGGAVTTAPSGATQRIAPTSSGSLTVTAYDQLDTPPAALVWSVSAATAAITIIIGGTVKATGVGQSALYTAPTNTRAVVTDITVTNPGSTQGYVGVALGGYDILSNTPVPAGGVLDLTCEQVLLPGDTISAGGSSGMNLHVSGRECV